MSVPDKTNIAILLFEKGQMRQDVFPSKKIGISVLGRTMNRRECLKIEHVREISYPLKVFFTQVLPGPDSGGKGHGIKAPRLLDTARYGVMVPQNRLDVSGANEVNTLIWTGVISDNVSQTNDLVNAHFIYLLKNSAEGLQIGVNVGYDGIPQCMVSPASQPQISLANPPRELPAGAPFYGQSIASTTVVKKQPRLLCFLFCTELGVFSSAARIKYSKSPFSRGQNRASFLQIRRVPWP